MSKRAPGDEDRRDLGLLLRFPRRKKNRASFGGTLCRAGSLELRLAETKKEIRKAQRLRYKVFYEEGGATPDRTAALIRRDVCAFDRVCDHLLVVDHAALNRFGRARPKVVGAYRLLRQEIAGANFGFYSAGEYDLAPLLARHKGKRFLELGRSCVLAPYRSKRVLELLWRGIGLYIEHHKIDAMFGCASFAGVDPASHARALSFLAHHAPSRPDWRVRALDARHVAMATMPRDEIDTRRTLAELPPLVKGYLRCGATFGDGAVVDRQFGTTDVFVVMPVADIDARVFGRFGAGKQAAEIAAA
ncbi:MAG: GNAT family N-acetyltransferase [Methylobacteriaceae bacterium]|nr:GNAT family N-acetyltransferase [Methylobacteriaceae bacterium]